MKFSKVLVAFVGASLASAAVIERSSPAIKTVIADLAKIDGDATTLLKNAQATDGTDLGKDITLGMSAKTLETDIDSATDTAEDIKAKDVTQADAKTILAAFTKIEPTAKAICLRLKKIKPGFQKAGVYPIVTDAVSEVPPRIKKIGQLVVKLAPSNYKARAKALLAKYEKDLDVCVKSYPPSK